MGVTSFKAIILRNLFRWMSLSTLLIIVIKHNQVANDPTSPKLFLSDSTRCKIIRMQQHSLYFLLSRRWRIFNEGAMLLSNPAWHF
jgi:hypothetical protein